MKYVKKPVVVDAFQFGVDELPPWFIHETFDGNIVLSPYDKNHSCRIRTLEGVMEAYKGDMIIKGIQGEIYPCKKDIFDATYESVADNEE